MNVQQNRRYFFEWARLRDMLLARGFTHADCEEFRTRLTVKAVGYEKSHMSFSDAEFTEWRKKCSAATKPGGLLEQLGIEDSNEACLSRAREGCEAACLAMLELGDARMADAAYRTNYVASTARRIVKKEFSECAIAEVAVVRGVLNQHLKRLKKRAAEQAELLAAGKRREGDPF